jgi:hypothetical protein
VAYGYWEQKGLTSALTDQGLYEFAVSGAGDDYIDLGVIFLCKLCKGTSWSVVKPDFR